MSTREQARAAVLDVLDDLDFQQTGDWAFTVRLPGSAKLATDCGVEVGVHTLALRAFVVRNPDENHAACYRWLLERNLKLTGVAFSVDALGDIYLVARTPVAAVSAELLDALLGVIAATADEGFNPLLGLGFAAAIRREWQWRLSRAESTANLAAFEHLRPVED